MTDRRGPHSPERAPFDFVWDEAAVRFFWDAQPVPVHGFFTDTRVDLFAGVLRRFARRPGPLLEIGVGSGALLARLRQDGWRGWGVDVSPDLVAALAKRGLPGVVGGVAALPFARASFDGAIMLEVLEHLLPGHAEAGLDEIARVLRPNGILLLSTPHDERLEDHRVVCPNCGALFHTVQHVRSFTVAGLRALMEARGFRTLLCLPTKFRRTALRADWAMRLRAWWAGVRGKKDPHLLYVGLRQPDR